MKYFKAVIFSAVFFVILQCGTASADSFDNLQAALISGKYTLRYENITPPARQNSLKERAHVFNGKMYTADSYMMHNTVKGVISSNGTDRYIETSAIQSSGLIYSSCSLKHNDEIFYFTRLEEKGKIEYIGKVDQKSQKDKSAVSSKISAVKFRRSVFLGNPNNFSDDVAVSKVLNALLPNSEKSSSALIFRKVKSGVLPHGLEYTDLMAVNPPSGVIFDAIRYYFQDGQIVKIATGQYFGSGENLDGTRTIIKVTEFKTSAEDKLLQLPKELKIQKSKD